MDLATELARFSFTLAAQLAKLPLQRRLSRLLLVAYREDFGRVLLHQSRLLVTLRLKRTSKSADCRLLVDLHLRAGEVVVTHTQMCLPVHFSLSIHLHEFSLEGRRASLPFGGYKLEIATQPRYRRLPLASQLVERSA